MDIIEQLSSHINDLVLLGKKYSIEQNINELERATERFFKEHLPPDYHPKLFRGADIQVVKCEPGSTIEQFHENVVELTYSTDEPCPSRFPILMSGLIREIQKNADYLDAANKYAFYGEIAQHAQHIELNYPNLDKQTVCREIIFNQLRLVTSWRNNLEAEANEPSLLDRGWKIYFGYGRNTNHDEMLSNRRCPEAIFMGPAILNNYQFIIDEKGYASVIKQDGSLVYGVLWAVSPADFDRLDLREGVRIGSYRKETLQVSPINFSLGDSLDAVVYISNRVPGNRPAEGYVEQIIDGLLSSGIGHDQISYLYKYLEKAQPITLNNPIKVSASKPEFLPANPDLPFFAYGLFKSTEIAHERIAAFVEKIENCYFDHAFLAIRDGIPLLGHKDQLSEAPEHFMDFLGVNGEIITFKTEQFLNAYGAIASLEPSSYYSWATAEIEGRKVNYLAGKKIFRGSEPLNHDQWSLTLHDPFISDLDQMLDRLLDDEERQDNVVELQAAYIMIWSGIERLITLRYSMKKRTESDIKRHLCSNEKICDLFKGNLTKPEVFRDIHASDQPRNKVSFKPGDVKKCIEYLRAIRHNVVHRGKAGFVDTELTFTAIGFARKIFQALY